MKRTILALCLSLGIAAPAFAQQQQQPSLPETALQISAVIGQWAQAIAQQGKLIEQMQARIKELEPKEAELAKAQVRIKELETKAEKPKE